MKRRPGYLAGYHPFGKTKASFTPSPAPAATPAPAPAPAQQSFSLQTGIQAVRPAQPAQPAQAAPRVVQPTMVPRPTAQQPSAQGAALLAQINKMQSNVTGAPATTTPAAPMRPASAPPPAPRPLPMPSDDEED